MSLLDDVRAWLSRLNPDTGEPEQRLKVDTTGTIHFSGLENGGKDYELRISCA